MIFRCVELRRKRQWEKLKSRLILNLDTQRRGVTSTQLDEEGHPNVLV